ncbi:MAG: lipoprotein [Dehalococcoidia bacterium]|nr:MAG: lipoprotein [Dehalococcoidia bacterium]
MRRVVLFLVASLLAFVVVFGGALALAYALRPRTLTGSPLAEPIPAADFTLRDTAGGSVSLASLRGRPVLLTFGYTHCPDVCPLTLSNLAAAKRLLGRSGQDLQVLFITVDPERDTPTTLRAYLDRFDPAFIGLVPTPEELPALARTYTVQYERLPGSEASGYLMGHTSATFVLDRELRIRLLLWPEMTPEQIAGDLRTVLGL